MPQSVTAYRVLIGSPSDVDQQRKIVESAIHAWNSMNVASKDIILMPMMWESDSAPLQGDRPQGILNTQIVEDCDIIIAIFWSRLGSDTGREKSGTVEEIKHFIKNKMPALMYFSTEPLPQHHDAEQWSNLLKFKKEIQTGGIQADFKSDHDLFLQIVKHLTIIMDNMNTRPTVVSKEVNRLIKQKSQDVSDRPVRKEPEKITDSNFAFLKKHTERSFIVMGVEDENYIWPEGVRGQFISIGNGKKAWQFSLKRQKVIALALGIPNELKGL